MASFKNELIALLPRLRRFALATTRSRHEADDLVQAAVEKALRHESSWTPGTQLDSWLFKIMQNLWLDELRAHRRKAEPLERIADRPSEESDDAMMLRLQLIEVRAALAGLPVDQQAVLAMVVLNGMSYQATAAALDIPVGTVMSRLARGRAALATRLGHREHRIKLAKG